MQNKTLISIILVVIVIALIIIGWGATRSNNESIDLLATTTDQTSVASTTETISPIEPQQASSTITQPNQSKKMQQIITLETSLGTIQFETYNQDAPNTVANFVKLSNQGYYNGLTFHRVIKGFMIQGGDPNCTPERSKGPCGTGGPGYQFADELNPETASYKAGYVKGVVAMANSGPNTNGSQFFIMHADYPLDHNYTIFGKVIKGQDVVDKIANVKTAEGDRPVTAVVIKNVKVSDK
ncbi:MAG: peptidylprolyl isomerase [Candidatus Paceibacterota bacterium]|jgi:cyclophilin family peptidyl-prolyl cis-trans isomerase